MATSGQPRVERKRSRYFSLLRIEGTTRSSIRDMSIEGTNPTPTSFSCFSRVLNKVYCSIGFNNFDVDSLEEYTFLRTSSSYVRGPSYPNKRSDACLSDETNDCLSAEGYISSNERSIPLLPRLFSLSLLFLA